MTYCLFGYKLCVCVCVLQCFNLTVGNKVGQISELIFIVWHCKHDHHVTLSFMFFSSVSPQSKKRVVSRQPHPASRLLGTSAVGVE